MQNPKLILATHNDHKLEEFKRILYSLFAEKFDTERAAELTKDGVIASAKDLGLSDVIEDGSTFEENAYIKAKHVFDVTEIAAIADDSGLVVDILGNAPGIFSARWSGKHGDDLANVELLLAQLSDVPQRNRTARFVCAVAVVSAVDSSRVLPFIVRGEVEGVIAEKMSGINGFGYDPIFIPNEQPANNMQVEGAQAKSAHPVGCIHAQSVGRPLTFAEFTPEQKNAISHRARAIEKALFKIEELCRA